MSDESNRHGVIFIRGVGDAEPNASKIAAENFFGEYKISESDAREVNWGWEIYIKRPTTDSSRDGLFKTDISFFLTLSKAYINTAVAFLPVSSFYGVKFILRGQTPL